MAGRSTDFTYSKNNTGAFKVPAEYREMLGIGPEAVATKEKKKKSKPTSNKKGGFNFMRLIRIVAFVVMVATLVVLGDKLLEIHDAEPGVKESDNPVDKDTIEGEIEFRNVCFSYEKQA